MNVLVTGGAGYIGSHAVRQLLAAGHQVTVLDNLFRGHRAAVSKGAELVEGTLLDTPLLIQTMQRRKIDCVMHFAALAYVGESVTQPLDYYDANTNGSLSLLKAIDQTGVRRMVFSSTCATYGQPEQMPIVETTPQRPINPYGASKLFVERMLLDYAASQPQFGFAALRYFNVAGCAPDGSLGEDHEPETHLIPVILLAALGKRKSITVFGTDYPTPDGTCIRDYIHVEDLIAAHVQLMGQIKPGDQRFYNVGIGQGYSVKQVIDAARRIVGREIKVEYGERRPGDPPELYANADRILQTGWKPRYKLDDMIQHAWNWFSRHPEGYGDR